MSQSSTTSSKGRVRDLLSYSHWFILVGFAEMYYYGVEGDFNVMVIDILGPTLQRMFEFCDMKFSAKTMCMIAIQCIDRLEVMHDKGFLHRDLKPENFLLGF